MRVDTKRGICVDLFLTKADGKLFLPLPFLPPPPSLALSRDLSAYAFLGEKKPDVLFDSEVQSDFRELTTN